MNGRVHTDEHMRACEFRVVGAVVNGGAAVRTCASTQSLEAIGQLTKRPTTFVAGHATGHRLHGFGRTPGAGGATAGECRMRHAQYSHRSLGGAHDATCKTCGVTSPSCVARLAVCARDRVQGERVGCCARG